MFRKALDQHIFRISRYSVLAVLTFPFSEKSSSANRSHLCANSMLFTVNGFILTAAAAVQALRFSHPGRSLVVYLSGNLFVRPTSLAVPSHGRRHFMIPLSFSDRREFLGLRKAFNCSIQFFLGLGRSVCFLLIVLIHGICLRLRGVFLSFRFVECGAERRVPSPNH